jgi:hypothetical protein
VIPFIYVFSFLPLLLLSVIIFLKMVTPLIIQISLSVTPTLLLSANSKRFPLFTISFFKVFLYLAYQIFPVPGDYHFRFRRLIGSTTVWMDATNDTSPVPLDSNGNVFSKVSRVSLGNLRPQQPQSAPQKAAPPPEILLATSPKTETPKSLAQNTEPKTRERRNSDKLLSFDNFDEPSPAPAGKSSSLSASSSLP